MLIFRGVFSALISRESRATVFLVAWTAHFGGMKPGLGVTFLI